MHNIRMVRKLDPGELVAIPFGRVYTQGIIGLDLSLRGPGLAVLLDGQLHRASAWTDLKGLQKDYCHLLSWFKMAKNTESDRQHRIDMIVNWVCGAVVEAGRMAESVCVALEGYAFSKRSTGLSDIHELGGAVKGWLWSRRVPYRTYDPLTVKLAWTGKGNAEKRDMLEACGRAYRDLWVGVGKSGAPRHLLGLAELAERDEMAASNIADAVLIAALLHEELELKAGRSRLDRLDPSLRRVMIRTTKSEPEALVSRPFITREAASPPQPILVRP